MNDPKTIALKYIDGCGRGDFDAVAALLAPDIHFSGPGGQYDGAEPYLKVLRRLGQIWKGSQVKRVFADGDEVCVIYDFVTDTAAGSVPTIEWLKVEGGRIAQVRLFFDRVQFAPAAEELNRRSPKPT